MTVEATNMNAILSDCGASVPMNFRVSGVCLHVSVWTFCVVLHNILFQHRRGNVPRATVPSLDTH